jgi:hypothetical protein
MKQLARRRAPSALAMIVGACVTAAVCAPAIAKANKYVRHSSAFCAPDTTNDAAGYYAEYDPELGFRNPSQTYYEGVWCPIIDTSAFSKVDISYVRVHVRDESPNELISTYACTKNYSGTSYNCGTPARTSLSGTGDFTLSPDVSAWTNNPYDWGYLYVYLGRRHGSGAGATYQSVSGYYTHD